MIGTEKLTLDQFNAMYEKNNGGKEAAQKATVEDREKFLDLYTTFKLKVMDAYALGYQNDPSILAELSNSAEPGGNILYQPGDHRTRTSRDV